MERTNVRCLICKTPHLLKWSIFTGMDTHWSHCLQTLVQRSLCFLKCLTITLNNLGIVWRYAYLIIHVQSFNNNINLLYVEQHYSKLNRIIHAACNKLIAKTPNPTLMSRLNKLVFLNLRGSKSLKSLPSGIFSLEFLTKLDLSGCSKLKRLPEISSGNISWFFLRGTAIEELPSSIERLLRLGYLDLSNCKRLKNLPSSLYRLKSLGVLNLCGCSNLQRLPECLGQLSYPIILNLAKTNIERIPESIMQLFVLRYLLLGYSERFQSLPKPSFLARGCQTLQRFLGLFSKLWIL